MPGVISVFRLPSAARLAAQMKQMDSSVPQEHLDSSCRGYEHIFVSRCSSGEEKRERYFFFFFCNFGIMEGTVPDGAAHDGLLLLATASGLSGCRLDVASTPAHPQLQGEVVARQRRDDGIRYRGNVVGPVEGEDQGGVGRGKCGQSRGPISSRRRRGEEVDFTPDSSW